MKQTNAFSLLELAIVLAIIGLIAGGIVAGSSMIRAAELRGVMTEYQQYYTALHTFKEKYSELPGDMSQATRFWGRADGGTDLDLNCADPVNNDGAGTCNGNGNGEIGDDQGGSLLYNEVYRAWQQLELAGIINGTFNGIGSDLIVDDFAFEPGVNAPTSKVNGAGWQISLPRKPNQAGHDGSGLNEGQRLIVGIPTNSFGPIGTFTPAEVWGVDKKLDDGKPRSGKVMTYYIPSQNCSTATAVNQYDVEYTLDDEVVDCAMLFTNIFD